MPDVRRSISLLVVLAALVLSVLAAAPATAGAGSEDPPPPPTTVVAGANAVVDNEFLPEERDLSECVSAVERPGCGSKARGGWRQWLVAAVLVSALVFIAWRIVRSVRRVPTEPDPAQNRLGAPR